MKAAVFSGPAQVSVREFPVPVCPPGGLLTRVDACAICGSDLRMYEYGPADMHSIHGHECVMTVIQKDSDVRAFDVGDRVLLCPVTCGTCRYCLQARNQLCANKSAVRSVVQGGYAQYRPIGPEALERGFLIKIPPDLDDERATLVEPLSCVLNGQEKLNIYPGKSVAIVGAGPIGNLHLQMATMRGALETILIDVLDRRLDANRASGPTLMVNSLTVDPVAAVMRATNGHGADVVIVACVSAAAQAQALHMVTSGGQVCFFAALPPDRSEVTLDTNIIHNREITVIGARSSSRRHFELAIELIRSRRIDVSPLITHTLPLSQIDEGFRLVKSGNAMKVVIRP